MIPRSFENNCCHGQSSVWKSLRIPVARRTRLNALNVLLNASEPLPNALNTLPNAFNLEPNVVNPKLSALNLYEIT